MVPIEPTIAAESGCHFYIPQPLPAAALSPFYNTACGKTVIWHGERELPGIGYMVDVVDDPDDILSSAWKGEVCGYSISTVNAPGFGLVWTLQVLAFPYGQGFPEHDRLRKFRSENRREIEANGIKVVPGHKLLSSRDTRRNAPRAVDKPKRAAADG